MLFCKDGSSWLHVIDDAGVLFRRLEILENLLRKCTFDMPRTECKFVDDTAEGYDGSEMLLFLDESLLELLKAIELRLRNTKLHLKGARPTLEPVQSQEERNRGSPLLKLMKQHN